MAPVSAVRSTTATAVPAPLAPSLDEVRQGAVMMRGQAGASVKELQQALTAAGFGVQATGQFGPTTESVVKAFQKARGLTADGRVGPQTLKALVPAATSTQPASAKPAPSLADVRSGAVMERGQAGASVKELQLALTAAGFGVQATGQFGPTTESVVKAFQKARGLTADGRVGSATLRALETGPGPQQGRALATPVLNQHDSGSYPGGYCAITALRMTLRLEGKRDPGADAVALGGSHPYSPGAGSSGSLLAARARELGLPDASYTTTGSLADIKAQLAKGHAVPVGGEGRFRGTASDGWVWDHTYSGGGHWMTVVGYDAAKRQFTVNDPDRGTRFTVTESDFQRFFTPDGANSAWMITY